MKLKRSMAIVLMTCGAAAIFAWSHAESRARKAAAPASRQLVPADDTSLILAGTIGPATTTPISGRNWNLAVPLNTWVYRGEAIGTEESQPAPGEMNSARHDLEDARLAELKAEDEVRQAEEALVTIQEQVSSMVTQKARAQAAEFDAERELERRDTLLRSGLTSQFDYNTAVSARASAEEAVDSISSKLAETSIETDEWEAKAQAAQADLREAATRRNAAEGVVGQMHEESQAEPIVSPADGIIMASGQPDGTSFRIASDGRQLCAFAMLRPVDLVVVRVGQESLIVLDAHPAVTLYAKVSAISEVPVDSSEGALYQVTFVVDNPGGMALSGAAMHARMVRSPR